MGYRDLLQVADETFVAPWIGGRTIRTPTRAFWLDGDEPSQHGWHRFLVAGRKVRWEAPASPEPDVLHDIARGYLVADRLVPDDVGVRDDVALAMFERVHLIEPGLDRFVRIRAGRTCDGGPLIYDGQELPLGPEDQVLQAYLDGEASVDHIPGVAPSLDGTFRMEHWRRETAKRIRLRDERRRELRRCFGDGAARRAMAQVDFETAARTALAVGGAHYLDHRSAPRGDEMVVRFCLDDERFECTCDASTLRIIDSGICLIDHETEERGDAYFTLESLPGVIRQAQREGRLVVFRHIE
jgi:hypothetical protein